MVSCTYPDHQGPPAPAELLTREADGELYACCQGCLSVAWPSARQYAWLADNDPEEVIALPLKLLRAAARFRRRPHQQPTPTNPA